MTDHYVPALRRRFLEDMRIKGLQPKTQTMYLRALHEFTRFLIHVLPSGFHRIRHAGFLANGIRRNRIEKIRLLIHQAPEPEQMTGEDAQEQDLSQTCPKCGGAMRVIEIFTRGQTPRSRAPPWEDAA